MSKSNGGNNNDINMVFIERLIEAIGDLTVRIEELNKSLFSGDFFEKSFSKHISKYNASNKTEADLTRALKGITKDFESALKVNFDVGTTKKLHAAVSALVKGLAEEYKGLRVEGAYREQMLTGIKNFYSSAFFESMKGAQKGAPSSSLYFTNTLDNEKLTGAYKEFANKIGIKLDSVQYKLLTFFQQQEEKKGKNLKERLTELGVGIVEGLEKSKWVGGALHDTFRLIGLLGANWMSQFGRLGKILGGAFYIAMDAFGPTLVKLMLQGIGKVFGYLPGLMTTAVGSLAKIVWNTAATAVYQKGGSLLDLLTAPKGGRLTAARGVLGAAGRVAVPLALGAAAIGSGTESYKSFKQGDKVGGSAFGVGALGFGVAAIAAVVAGIAAPVTLIAAAIGGIAVAVGAIWKNREAIMDHIKKNQGFYEHVMHFMEFCMPILFVIRKAMEWWQGKSSGSSGGTTGGTTAESDFIAGFSAKNVGKLKVAKDGSVLNARDFTQSELAAEMQAYQKAQPKKFGNIYEVVGSKYANMASFQNDAIMTDQFTGQKGAIMYKGASEDMERIRAIAISKGMDPKVAERILYSSGWSTKTSGHSLGALGHGNRYGLAYDIGLAGFNTKEQQWILEAAQERAKEKGLRGQWVRAEANVGGRTVLSDTSVVAGTNQHIHAQMRDGYLKPEGADENIEEDQKARAMQTTNDQMAISDIVKNQLSKEEQKEFAEKLQKTSKSPEDLVESEKKVLKEMGYYQSQALQGSPWVKQVDGQETVLKNASGNYMFSADQQMQSIANRGVDY